MRHTVILDSQDREYGMFPYPNAYRLELPRNYRNVVRAKLLTAEIPATFYVFHGAKATMRFGIDGDFADVSIPDGNYTSSTIGPAIVAALQNVFAGYLFSATIDPSTSTATIACTSNPSAVVALDATEATAATHWGLGYYLGFEAGAIASGSGSITSPRAVCLNPQTYVVIDIPELNNIDETGKSAFAKIPFDTNSFGYAFYAPNADMPYVEFSPPIAKLSRLTITLRFHDGTVLDFKGVEHSLTLEIETKVKPDDPLQTQTHPEIGRQKTRKPRIVQRLRIPRPRAIPERRGNKRWALLALLVLCGLGFGWYAFTAR